jgi:acyl-coenzyme A synthetase/AMP-(fatty) acid ligase
VCLIDFTSGVTGEPTGIMHFHRMLAICNSKSTSRPMPGFRCNRISSS